jgi:hypothetical protein
MKRTQKPGYILTLTLALIALCMFISSYVFNRALVFDRLSRTMISREKSRMLASSGIQLGMSQLGSSASEEKEEKADAKEKASEGQQLLKAILPVLQKPQQYQLKQSIEGIDGMLILVLNSEEGKININRLYDYNKHQFVGEGQPNGDMKIMFKELFGLISQKIKGDLFEDFEKFLKDRKYPLNDVTELLTIKKFEIFKNNVFFNPTVPGVQDKIFLTDIFTVSSSKKEIDPWLFSHSLKVLLQLNLNVNPEDLLKNFKEQADWKNDWNKILTPVYGREFTSLPTMLATLLSPQFAPKIFTVLSQATVENVPVSTLAVLERAKATSKDTSPQITIRNVYLM